MMAFLAILAFIPLSIIWIVVCVMMAEYITKKTTNEIEVKTKEINNAMDKLMKGGI